MYAVLTIDQRGSQTGPDLVPALAEELNAPVPLRRFERTAGDELQGVVDRPEAVVSRLAVLIRSGDWNIGLGVGEAETPLPRTTRAGRGEVFVLARQAVTRAKHVPARLSVAGADPLRAEQLETVLWLWAGVLHRRTSRGWEVVDLLETGLSHAEAGARLGITQSAVSQRAAAAGLVEARRAERLAEQLLGDMLGTTAEKEDR